MRRRSRVWCPQVQVRGIDLLDDSADAFALPPKVLGRSSVLDGREFREILRADGTGRRCEFGDEETICEWTDCFGACSRSVTRSRRDSYGARPRAYGNVSAERARSPRRT